MSKTTTMCVNKRFVRHLVAEDPIEKVREYLAIPDGITKEELLSAIEADPRACRAPA